jgi:hypothetical protein
MAIAMETDISIRLICRLTVGSCRTDGFLMHMPGLPDDKKIKKLYHISYHRAGNAADSNKNVSFPKKVSVSGPGEEEIQKIC